LTIKIGTIPCPVCGSEGYITFIRVQHGSGKDRVYHYITEDEVYQALALKDPGLLVEAITRSLQVLRETNPENAKQLVKQLRKVIEEFEKRL